MVYYRFISNHSTQKGLVYTRGEGEGGGREVRERRGERGERGGGREREREERGEREERRGEGRGDGRGRERGEERREEGLTPSRKRSTLHQLGLPNPAP